MTAGVMRRVTAGLSLIALTGEIAAIEKLMAEPGLSERLSRTSSPRRR